MVNFAKVTVSDDSYHFSSSPWLQLHEHRAGHLASTLCGVICLNVLGRRYVSLRLGLKDWRRITRFGLQMFAVSVVGNIAAKLSDLLLGDW
jgi:hypothetical protein